MDDVVVRAMAKWPDVPAVHGWLGLDRRGRWRLKGEIVSNPALCAFIGRNYAVDGEGRWYFQNGPQRVYVSLEYTPWVWRLRGDGALEAHTGRTVERVCEALVDDSGGLLLVTELGVGVLDDRDLAPIAEGIAALEGEPLGPEQVSARLGALHDAAPATLSLEVCGRRVAVTGIGREHVARRFGFVAEPLAGG